MSEEGNPKRQRGGSIPREQRHCSTFSFPSPQSIKSSAGSQSWDKSSLSPSIRVPGTYELLPLHGQLPTKSDLPPSIVIPTNNTIPTKSPLFGKLIPLKLPPPGTPRSPMRHDLLAPSHDPFYLLFHSPVPSKVDPEYSRAQLRLSNCQRSRTPSAESVKDTVEQIKQKSREFNASTQRLSAAESLRIAAKQLLLENKKPEPRKRKLDPRENVFGAPPHTESPSRKPSPSKRTLDSSEGVFDAASRTGSPPKRPATATAGIKKMKKPTKALREFRNVVQEGRLIDRDVAKTSDALRAKNCR